jgi:anti-anti-sigma factor
VQIAILVEERAEGRVGLLAVEGELDLGTCGVLVDAVRRVGRDRVVAVEVDLHAVSFLAVAGAGALIRCRRMVNASGGAFRLVSPSAAVERLLVATGLDAVFDVFEARTPSDATAGI